VKLRHISNVSAGHVTLSSVPHVAHELRVVRPWRRSLMFQFVCMGGTPERMKDFAYYIMEEIGHTLPTGTMLQDISQKSYRYSMYKVGPVLSISVSIHYCQRLMGTALNMAAWAGFLVHGLTYRSCLSHWSLSLHLSLSTGHHLLSVRFKTSLQSNLCTTVTRQSITGKKKLIPTHKTQLKFSPMYFQVEYFSYR